MGPRHHRHYRVAEVSRALAHWALDSGRAEEVVAGAKEETACLRCRRRRRRRLAVVVGTIRVYQVPEGGNTVVVAVVARF